MRPFVFVIVVPALVGCRVLTSGIGSADARTAQDVGGGTEAGQADTGTRGQGLDSGEPPGTPGRPLDVGCSDGTREGFREVATWRRIAGCAGAFDQMGVIATPALKPTCGLTAGDSGSNPAGRNCTAADLCAEQWHLCKDGKDVADHSPTGDCEGCVPAGEPRFFLVASAASIAGVCSPDPTEANDLHGCGWLGQPESPGCFPLDRRMGFADCLRTNGIWECGDDSDAAREAAVVTKRGIALGGVLCCKD